MKIGGKPEGRSCKEQSNKVVTPKKNKGKGTLYTVLKHVALYQFYVKGCSTYWHYVTFKLRNLSSRARTIVKQFIINIDKWSWSTYHYRCVNLTSSYQSHLSTETRKTVTFCSEGINFVKPNDCETRTSLDILPSYKAINYINYSFHYELATKCDVLSNPLWVHCWEKLCKFDIKLAFWYS